MLIELQIQVIDTLGQVYKSVDDIDLYVGGLAEIGTLGDGIVGPTMACLIAENFNKLKYGDRFFYESRANPNPFGPSKQPQLQVQFISIFKMKLILIFVSPNAYVLALLAEIKKASEYNYYSFGHLSFYFITMANQFSFFILNVKRPGPHFVRQQ